MRTKNIFKYQLVTRSIGRDCDKNHVFCATLRDKNGVENFVNPNGDTYFRVKGKRMAHLRSPEICREKVIFSIAENSHFHLGSNRYLGIHFTSDFRLCRDMFSLIDISNT